MHSTRRWLTHIFVTTLLSVSRLASASPLSTPPLSTLPTLHAGDIILVALNCYVCRVISETTNSPYNHSGLVLNTDKGPETRIAQSLTTTQEISLKDFLNQASKTSSIKILRPKELAHNYDRDRFTFESKTKVLNDVFTQKMQGRAFDDNYLWDNFDNEGQELLYCSEMIQKTLNSVLSQPLMTIALDYSRHWDFWLNYFGSEIPQGEPGNSPASLAAADQLSTIFEGTLDAAK